MEPMLVELMPNNLGYVLKVIKLLEFELFIEEKYPVSWLTIISTNSTP